MGHETEKILLKEPETNHIEMSDRFYVNDSFTSKYHCVKLKQIREKSENISEQQEQLSKVERDRENEINAAITRIMKAHRTMGHAELINEVHGIDKICSNCFPRLLFCRSHIN